jgi:glycosyltransferase involved in cell wall biosynthesis
LHVCLSCIEFFGRGIQGGFGRATRFLGRELVRRGIQVSVVAPRRGQLAEGMVDGMLVMGFDPWRPWTAVDCYRECKADIYHSQDTSMGTALARLAMPKAKHIVTFRDPMEASDWRTEAAMSGKNRLAYLSYRCFIDNPWVDHAVRRVDARYCAARFLMAKVVRKYAFTRPPEFLPTPVDIPSTVEKTVRPTVVFNGRWDPRKRPERFIELARRFPKVDFIAVGASSNPVRDAWIRGQAASVPNLQLPGVIDQFASDRLSRVLSSSWVLVNTSPREGLPNAFLEAAAHGCALLSLTDPDAFASRFGALAEDGTLEERLAWLLEEGRWRERGAAGRDFVRQVFATPRALEEHRSAYERALESHGN